MQRFRITLDETQTVLSTYAVTAETMDEALETLAENDDSGDCVDSETLENTFLRFRSVYDPETGEERPVTDDQNQQLLGERFHAGV